MVQVSHLTRRFGRTVAVRDVSFDISRGDVVGVLGPNGAGKTTTLRILTGFLPPSGGSVRVGGRDVERDPIGVRRRVGYLPEQCPLYPDMRVDEYLRYRAALKGVPARLVRRRVAEVKETCGLADTGRRVIGHLSKGYRQRVGMADALVHDPELLVLDEPTLGLDPSQIRQARDLIRELSARHTILLSSHILPEIEMTCRRVLILHRGRLLASDSTARLRGLLAGQVRVVAEVRAPEAEVRRALRELPGARLASVTAADAWCRVVLDAEGPGDLRPRIFETAAREGWSLRELRREQRSLEDVFLALTGEAGGAG
jgi:ABC-2 type transport system ATP-binding protein